jgi:hypothetical protein
MMVYFRVANGFDKCRSDSTWKVPSSKYLAEIALSAAVLVN